MKTTQQKVKDFTDKYKLSSGTEQKVLVLTHEVGEMAKEVLMMTGYGKKPLDEHRPSAKMTIEMGEILYCIADMANAMNIDLEEAFGLALDHIETKLQKRQ